MIFVVRFRRKATWRIVFGCVEQKSNHLRLSEKPSQVIKGHIHRPQHRYQYTPHTPSQPLVLVQCYPRTACRTRYIPISTNSSKVPFLTQQRTTVISLCSETTFSFKCIVLVMMAPDHGRYVLCVVVCQCVILQCQVVCEDKERRKGSNILFFFSGLNAATQSCPQKKLCKSIFAGTKYWSGEGDCCVWHKIYYVNTTLEVSLLLLCVT